jgi:SAM-dependent methyltransferase
MDRSWMGAAGDRPLWVAHQRKMWQEYQDGVPGVFTPADDEMGHYVGEIIARSGGGLYLDVGCGALPWPSYMATSSEPVTWIGLDPFLGDVPRRFPFVQGMGETLPFRRETFDGALYVSSIYHLMDPGRSLRRTRHVLKPGGKLYLWFTATRPGRRYWTWRGLRALGVRRMYNADFQWAFTRGSLERTVERAGFVVDDEVFLCTICPDLPTCENPGEYLLCAHRA